MNKKTMLLLSVLLGFHALTKTEVSASNPLDDENNAWWRQLMEEINTPIPTPRPAPVQPPVEKPLTATELANKLTELSDEELSMVLETVATQLSVATPTGTEKTNTFLKGLYSALDTLQTLIMNTTKSTDLNGISNLKQYLRSKLLHIAGSL